MSDEPTIPTEANDEDEGAIDVQTIQDAADAVFVLVPVGDPQVERITHHVIGAAAEAVDYFYDDAVDTDG